MTEFVGRVRQSADKKVIYSLHALNEMNSEREIITAYIPTVNKWENDFKTRRKNR